MVCKVCVSSLNLAPAAGTSCGNHKWCMEGKCVSDSMAPSFRGTLGLLIDAAMNRFTVSMVWEIFGVCLDCIQFSSWKIWKILIIFILSEKKVNLSVRKRLVNPIIRILSNGKLFFLLATKYQIFKCFPYSVTQIKNFIISEKYEFKGKITILKLADSCLSGDQKELVQSHQGPQSCKRLVAERPGYCYEKYYRDTCCASCLKLKQKKNSSLLSFLFVVSSSDQSF